MRIICIIPARYESTRFPGKPIADLCGKPMIWWVYQQCKKVKLFTEVAVATDSEIIVAKCRKHKINVTMTSDGHLTGTDRVAEAAKQFSADLIVNVQGDEPLIEPKTIEAAITPFYEQPNLQVSNLMTKITNPIDVVNNTVPKVITNSEGIGIYLTRATAPFPKNSLSFDYYKQVCVYGFRPQALRFFSDYGIHIGKSKNEQIEDIEILRFIDNGYKVQFIEVDSNTIAVDTIKDLERVRSVLYSQSQHSNNTISEL